MYKYLTWFSGIALIGVATTVAFSQIVQFQSQPNTKTPPVAQGVSSATRTPALSPDDFAKKVDEKSKKTDQDLADRAFKMLKPPLPPLKLPNMNQAPPPQALPTTTKTETIPAPTNTYVPEVIPEEQPVLAMPPVTTQPAQPTTTQPAQQSKPYTGFSTGGAGPGSRPTNTPPPSNSNAGGWSIGY